MLAEELQIDPKRLRAWMRKQKWRDGGQKHQPWEISPAQADDARDHFGQGRILDAVDPPQTTVPVLSVGELLQQYENVLDTLRDRGLIRTRNAPYGDLAEHCALDIYGGVLAANSTASYDLVTDDGLRVQVKYRQISEEAHRSVPFSPLRTLGFDLCLFVLVGDRRVVTAREWTTADVEEHRVARSGRNDWIIKTGQVLNSSTGADRTRQFHVAWERLLARRH